MSLLLLFSLFLLFFSFFFFFFFFNDTATTEIYTLSLHDALPISPASSSGRSTDRASVPSSRAATRSSPARSEEHTSELQSQSNLVCRLLLEKKKKRKKKKKQNNIQQQKTASSRQVKETRRSNGCI